MALDTLNVPPGEEPYDDIPEWPGLEFPIHSEEAKVILGSPNGLVAGHFRKFSSISCCDDSTNTFVSVAQHKTQLGNKFVYKVTVFADQENGFTQLLFWIQDVP